MQDIFSKRHTDAFWELMDSFLDSLTATFPECPATKDWSLWAKNVVMGDADKMREGVAKWHGAMCTPLVKGCAKYAKAVQSITGKPACMYHAVAYKDIDAAHASSEYMRDLDLPTKLASDRMDAKARAVFWEYMAELNSLAYKAERADVPDVPTSQQIAADIKRRKANPAGAVQGGLVQAWQALCDARRSTTAFDAATLPARLAKAAAAPCGEETVGAGCQRADPAAFAALAEAMPELQGDPPTEEQWKLLSRALGLADMEAAIPPNMLRGIEGVASRLAQDIVAGKADLASLDIEALGQQVLAGVETADVDSFADNLDKILPALGKIAKPPA